MVFALSVSYENHEDPHMTYDMFVNMSEISLAVDSGTLDIQTVSGLFYSAPLSIAQADNKESAEDVIAAYQEEYDKVYQYCLARMNNGAHVVDLRNWLTFVQYPEDDAKDIETAEANNREFDFLIEALRNRG